MSCILDKASSLLGYFGPVGDDFFGGFVGETLKGIGLDALVVAVALHIYLVHVSPRWLGTPKAKKALDAKASAPKWASGASKGAVTNRAAVKAVAAPNPNPNRGTSTSANSRKEEAQAVQRLVLSITRARGKCGPAAVEEYKKLTQGRRVDLRRHIPEDRHARSLYAGLISCSIQSVAATGSNPSAKSSTARLLSDMRSFGFPRDHDFYTLVMKTQMQGRMLQDAIWLYDELVADGFLPDRAMYTMLMNAAISCDERQKAVSFYEELAKLGPLPMRTYMAVLRVYSGMKDWKGALNLFNNMKDWSVAPDTLILNTVLGLCVASSEVAVAEGLHKEWGSLVDVVSCNTLLKAYSQQANIPQAEQLLQRMVDQGPTPNIISFNTVMDCVVRAVQANRSQSRQTQARGREDRLAPRVHVSSSVGGQSVAAAVKRPWELLDQLMALGLEPDRYTCSTLVKGMHLTGGSPEGIDRAAKLIRQIGPAALQSPGAGSSGHRGTCNTQLLEVLFNTLLDLCVAVRDLDRMAEIFAMMQEFKVDVSAVTLNTLIKAFGQAGKLNHCHEVWERIQDANLQPTIVTFGCYIDACIRNNDIASAQRIFASMCQQGIKPNAVICTSLIRGFAHAKQPGKAMELYETMRQEGVVATLVTFNSVLDTIAHQMEPERLQTVLDDMRKANVKPDVVTYSILIKASCNGGHVGGALDLFKEVRSDGIVFDEVAFNTLLLACSKGGRVRDAEEVFAEMIRVGVSPTHVTTSILVKMYGRAKMLDQATAIVEQVERDHGVKPNVYVYTCIIQACVQNDQYRRGMSIFDKMLRAGVAPDAVTYGAVIHGCIYQNRFEVAMSLVRHACMLPALAPTSASDEEPFDLSAVKLREPLPLQADVLQALVNALRRKEQRELLAELEQVMARHVAAERNCGGRSSRTADYSAHPRQRQLPAGRRAWA